MVGLGYDRRGAVRRRVPRARPGCCPGCAAEPAPVPRIADLRLRAPRIEPPASLADRCSTDPADRAGHTYGKAYRDVIRALRADLPHPPDLVARPRDEQDVVDLLDWASSTRTAVIPYGGGSSVVGGVEYRGDEHPAVLSLDLGLLDRVLEIDEVSHAARIQAGALGPALEAQLRERDLTLRHYPQSFEFSTLGGWLATRSGGHFATVETHIDDLTESIRALTPSGVYASWRLPGSGAGPSPDRLLLGSEGTLGVITEAWMRVRPRPSQRASASVVFGDLFSALDALREITQSGLRPANCRVLDEGEALLAGAGNGDQSVLVLGFESSGVPVDRDLADAIELAVGHGGVAPPPRPRGERDAGADAWRSAFLRMPYVRDGLARIGGISDTFETAMTWERVGDLIADVRAVMPPAIDEACGAPGRLNCRITHAYPDGCAPYFSVIAAGAARRGARDVGRAEGRGVGDPPAPRRHDHPPPRRRSRPSPVVRRAAPGPVRGGAARGQA